MATSSSGVVDDWEEIGVPYDPERHHRRSIRLKGHDYSIAAAYFVTICIQDRACVLGEIIDGESRPSAAGEIVATTWADLPERLPTVEVDTFVILPNHVHGVIFVGAR